MKFKKFFTVICIIVIALTGCRKEQADHIAIFYNDYNEYSDSLKMKIEKRFSQTKNMKTVSYNAKLKQEIQTNQIKEEIRQGARLIAVDAVNNNSAETVTNIVNMAKNADVSLVFFDRYVDCKLLDDFHKAVYIGWDESGIGKVQGGMIAEYLLTNYDMFDMNGDGTISYAMFISENDLRSMEDYEKQCIEEADRVLAEKGKPALNYYNGNLNRNYFSVVESENNFEDAYNQMKTTLETYKNEKMIELIIASNDGMALGAIKALREVGYNSENAEKFIPVFGVGATNDAKNAIYANVMTGTVVRNTDRMSMVFKQVSENILKGKNSFDGVDKEIINRKNCILIPYEVYYGKKNI